ncbi:MAG: hypothetical protein E4G98_02995 [Promethearchaeota archaeon]|nr:MAG: hypothetical protein E4G98_02995 [Candidatus Lokiarchaeota archaeon]
MNNEKEIIGDIYEYTSATKKNEEAEKKAMKRDRMRKISRIAIFILVLAQVGLILYLEFG